MNLKGLKLGIALCGSYCTYDIVFKEINKLASMGVDIFPIMSENSYKTNTRFGKAEYFIKTLENITNKKVIHTIKGAEPLGPQNLVDALLIAPCTGNTLAKISSAITDSSVTMATKSVLRNQNPVVIALATNDGLGASLSNIGKLTYSKNIYFVPMGQDNYIQKPNSLISHMELIPKSIEKAVSNKQIQPFFSNYKK